jgi:hypothetical protein
MYSGVGLSLGMPISMAYVVNWFELRGRGMLHHPLSLNLKDLLGKCRETAVARR